MSDGRNMPEGVDGTGAGGEPDRGAQLRPLELGQLLDAAVKLYQRNWATFIGVTAAIIVPWTVLEYLATREAASQVVPAAIGIVDVFVITPLVAGVLAKTVADVYLGQRPAVGTTYAYVAGKLLTLIGITILTALAVIGGMILLIIPGIIFATRFFGGTVVAVVEGEGTTDSMRRSWRLVKGRTGKVLLTLFVAGLLAVVVTIVIVLPFAAAGSNAVVLLGELLASLLTAPFTAAVSVLIYFDLRVRSEAFDLERLARQLSAGTHEG